MNYNPRTLINGKRDTKREKKKTWITIRMEIDMRANMIVVSSDYKATAIGGSTSLSKCDINAPVRYLRILPLIFKLIIAFFKYGNHEVYFHICGHRDSWDCPMNAEGLEVRHSGCGPKITIW